MAATTRGEREFPPLSVSTLDPQWVESRIDSSMQVPNNGNNGSPPTIGEFLSRWAHLSVTVTILIFLWGQYESFQAYRRDAERTMTVNTERIIQLQRANESQDREYSAALATLTARVDLHRELIIKLQQQLTDHSMIDERRSRR